MPPLPSRHWSEMTSADFAMLDGDRTVAVLPVAAIEQHGPHLPVEVDACINAGIIARMIDALPHDLPVTVLPMQSVGKSVEHLQFPGTLTLSAETFLRVLVELGDGVRRAGLRKLVLFNSHGGNVQLLEVAARELRVRHDMMVVPVSWGSLGKPADLFPPEEERFGIHAGAVETSMMMHLRPDLVRTEHVRRFGTLMEDLKARQVRTLTVISPVPMAWMSQDINPDGAMGDATLATAEAGRMLVDHAALRLVELLRELSDLPLSTLRNRT